MNSYTTDRIKKDRRSIPVIAVTCLSCGMSGTDYRGRLTHRQGCDKKVVRTEAKGWILK